MGRPAPRLNVARSARNGKLILQIICNHIYQYVAQGVVINFYGMCRIIWKQDPEVSALKHTWAIDIMMFHAKWS